MTIQGLFENIKYEVDFDRCCVIESVGFYAEDGHCFLLIQDSLRSEEFSMYVPTTNDDSDKVNIDCVTTAIFGESKLKDCDEALKRSTLGYGCVCVCRLSREDEYRLFNDVCKGVCT